MWGKSRVLRSNATGIILSCSDMSKLYKSRKEGDMFELPGNGGGGGDGKARGSASTGAVVSIAAGTWVYWCACVWLVHISALSRLHMYKGTLHIYMYYMQWIEPSSVVLRYVRKLDTYTYVHICDENSSLTCFPPLPDSRCGQPQRCGGGGRGGCAGWSAGVRCRLHRCHQRMPFCFFATGLKNFLCIVHMYFRLHLL